VLVQFVDNVTRRASGVPTQNRVSAVYTVRDGRVVRIEYFGDHADALEASGPTG
jgi:ketosteroid isomerase-like protein